MIRMNIRVRHVLMRVGMFRMRGFIFWAPPTVFSRLISFILESHFNSLTKNLWRASAPSITDHFMTNLEQNVAITSFAIGHYSHLM